MSEKESIAMNIACDYAHTACVGDCANAIEDAILSIVSPLLETLKRVELDYKGLIKVCRQYSLYATYKDATETLEYLEKVIKDTEEKI